MAPTVEAVGADDADGAEEIDEDQALAVLILEAVEETPEDDTLPDAITDSKEDTEGIETDAQEEETLEDSVVVLELSTVLETPVVLELSIVDEASTVLSVESEIAEDSVGAALSVVVV